MKKKNILSVFVIVFLVFTSFLRANASTTSADFLKLPQITPGVFSMFNLPKYSYSENTHLNPKSSFLTFNRISYIFNENRKDGVYFNSIKIPAYEFYEIGNANPTTINKISIELSGLLFNEKGNTYQKSETFMIDYAEFHSNGFTISSLFLNSDYLMSIKITIIPLKEDNLPYDVDSFNEYKMKDDFCLELSGVHNFAPYAVLDAYSYAHNEINMDDITIECATTATNIMFEFSPESRNISYEVYPDINNVKPGDIITIQIVSENLFLTDVLSVYLNDLIFMEEDYIEIVEHYDPYSSTWIPFIQELEAKYPTFYEDASLGINKFLYTPSHNMIPFLLVGMNDTSFTDITHYLTNNKRSIMFKVKVPENYSKNTIDFTVVNDHQGAQEPYINVSPVDTPYHDYSSKIRTTLHKIPLKQSRILIQYLDQKGNVLLPDDVLVGNVGARYETTAKIIEDYELIESPSSTFGYYLDFDHTITYTYRKSHVSIKYTDGVKDKELFPDESYLVGFNTSTPIFKGNLYREGYRFTGWSPALSKTVLDDCVYVAQWEKIEAPIQPPLPEIGSPSRPPLPEIGLPSRPSLPETGLPSKPSLPETGLSSRPYGSNLISMGCLLLLSRYSFKKK